MSDAKSIADVLRENGVSESADGGLHGWRCDYPDMYGPCTCFEDMMAEFDHWLADHDRRVKAEALREAATELEQQGVEAWDRNTVAIRTLRFNADRIEAKS